VEWWGFEVLGNSFIDLGERFWELGFLQVAPGGFYRGSMNRGAQHNFFFINRQRLEHFNRPEDYAFCDVFDVLVKSIASTSRYQMNADRSESRLPVVQEQIDVAKEVLKNVEKFTIHDFVRDTVESYLSAKYH
jgi:hypothetical protein